MTRLNRGEIKQLRDELTHWRTPTELLTYTRTLMDMMGATDLFTQPGVDFITEAWAAAQFAKARRALRVRLVPERDQWPDFELRTRRGVESWEFTEADRPRRRRGDEVRRAERRQASGKRPRMRDISARRVARQAAQVPDWVRRRCRAKTKKLYGGSAGLLVYLNWSDYGWHPEVAASFLDATAPAKDAFTETWVLWSARVYRTWKGGASACMVRNALGTYDAYASR